MNGTVRGRFAPSPTGELHLGNASSALLAWLSARAQGGTFVMRVEDLDLGRVRPGLAERILDDLAWLGLDWDEGPDRGGPYGPYDQASRLPAHRAAFETLRASSRLYPCFCSRKDVAAAASAPQAPGDELRYPGTCRALGPAEARDRIAAGERHAWRFRVEGRTPPIFEDLVHGRWGEDKPPPGDFVVWRSDGGPSYQLAVVVDDAAMLITEVVRGDDLLPSAMRQLLLFEALGTEPPRFGHVPLLLGPDGARLSKRHASATLREMREAGRTPGEVLGPLAHALGLRPTPDPVEPRALVDGFSLALLLPHPQGLLITPQSWYPG
jgi:glutamyl-tRNA synthetase